MDKVDAETLAQLLRANLIPRSWVPSRDMRDLRQLVRQRAYLVRQASSFRNPLETAEIAALGALRVLESAKRGAPDARVFQASSAEIFGRARSSPQNEKTPLDPTSPYGIAKAFALMSSRFLREHDGMFVSNGIFYNHESPRRPPGIRHSQDTSWS
jgi:nucleoside-diphosphate-sugar epimerase